MTQIVAMTTNTLMGVLHDVVATLGSVQRTIGALSTNTLMGVLHDVVATLGKRLGPFVDGDHRYPYSAGSNRDEIGVWKQTAGPGR